MSTGNEFIGKHSNENEQEQVLRYWIEIAPGAFSVSQLSRDMKEQLSYMEGCEKLVESGELNRFGNKRGWYIPVNLDLEEMDFTNANDEPVDIWLPFDINKKVKLYQNNIIIMAGAPNAGKTAFVLNIVKENMRKFNVNYFNSEMTAGELKMRLGEFDHIDPDSWDFKAYARSGDFDAVVKGGPENINIIDFLECHEDFFAMGKKIKNIHDNLHGSIAIIAIQKNPGSDVGLGGFRSLEVTRLALAIDFGRLKIVKAKNYIGENPNGMVMNFAIHQGSQLTRTQGWHMDNKSKGE